MTTKTGSEYPSPLLDWDTLLNPDLFDTQVKVENFRLDFAIKDKKNKFKIAVELDGHTYHEKTVEQAVRDRSRDRELTANGWHVIRFHRAELEKSLSECIFSVYKVYDQLRTRNPRAT